MSPDYIVPRLAKDYQEYQTSECDISVVGSLAKKVEFWKYMNAPDHIIRTIEKGYTIPLKSLPNFLKNNKTSREIRNLSGKPSMI